MTHLSVVAINFAFLIWHICQWLLQLILLFKFVVIAIVCCNWIYSVTWSLLPVVFAIDFALWIWHNFHCLLQLKLLNNSGTFASGCFNALEIASFFWFCSIILAYLSLFVSTKSFCNVIHSSTLKEGIHCLLVGFCTDYSFVICYGVITVAVIIFGRSVVKCIKMGWRKPTSQAEKRQGRRERLNIKPGKKCPAPDLGVKS